MGEPVDFRTPEEIERDVARAQYEKAKFDGMKIDAELENANRTKELLNHKKALTGTALLLDIEIEKMEQINKDFLGKLKEHIEPEEKVVRGRGNIIDITPSKKNLVLLMSARGSTQAEIAYALGIGTTTLAKRFREQLDIGYSIDSSFIESAFRMASAQGISNPRFSGALALLTANRTDITPKGKVDITSGGAPINSFIDLPDNGLGKHVSRSDYLDKLKAIPEADVVDAEVVQLDDSGKPISNGENS